MGNTCWLHQVMILLFMVTLLPELLPSISAENQTHSNSECVFGDIESRLSVASEIIETAKKKLPKDLKELFKNFAGCNQTKILDCSETGNFDCKHFENKTCNVEPLDCSDIYLNGERRNGLYDVWPQSRVSTGSLQVYCDMESNGGGWTVIQRRGDYGNSQDYFFQEWDAYKRGFGDMQKEFWIGNDNLFALTNQRQYQLRVNLTAWDGDVAYATYDEFWILDENENYKLHVTGYNGTANDSLARHDGQNFTTTDRKNDLSTTKNCAETYKGAWWYEKCMDSNLNGMYLRGKNEDYGVEWKTFKGYQYSLKDTVMKVRPVGFAGV